MLLPELKRKALEFLKISCTAENITSRVLSKFSDLHDEVGAIYSQFFQRNWGQVKGTQQFNREFEEFEKMESEEVVRVNARFRELMNAAVFLDSA